MSGPKLDVKRWRYVPRSLDGGLGWGVWDRVLGRFLSDGEVMAVPMRQIQGAVVGSNVLSPPG